MGGGLIGSVVREVDRTFRVDTRESFESDPFQVSTRGIFYDLLPEARRQHVAQLP